MLKGFKKTKIICTIGPGSDNKIAIREMEKHGMNIARLNFSHETPESHKKRLDMIREVCPNVSILLDTKGPEIRTGKFKHENMQFTLGEEVIITDEEMIGDNKRFSISHKGLYKEIKVGDRILIDDGLLELAVTNIKGKDIVCEIYNTANLGSRKSVSMPNVHLDIKSPTKKDIEDIEWGIKNRIDFIALSFVRSKEEVEKVRSILKKHNLCIQIISKIENQAGVDNFDEILEVSDGIMVARGDLAVEIPAEKVPLLQKEIIRKCNLAGKPVITATQMLESMINNPRPTRAEVNDVANSVLDGSDAVMLSGETAKGIYPIQTVSQMASICRATEANVDTSARLKGNGYSKSNSVTSFITQSVYHASKDIPGIKAILTPTKSGFTARQISRFRPKVPIIAFCENDRIAKQLNLVWGVYPVVFEHPDTTSKLVHNSIKLSVEKNLIGMDDMIILTAGVPIKTSGTTNMLEVYKISDYLKYNHSQRDD